MSREWTQRDYQKSRLTGNPEGRKKRGLPRRTWKNGIYTAISERDLRMRMEQPKAMEYGSRKASPDVLKPRSIQGVTGGTDQTSGECSLGQTIPI